MKTNLYSILTLLALTLLFSCQDNSKEGILAPKRSKDASARRACSNQISYKFLLPDSDYGYGADGCQVYYIHRGVNRQVKVNMINVSTIPRDLTIEIHYQVSSAITYSVASYTGGTISNLPPAPQSDNAAFVWTASQAPRNTPFELTLNITGGPSYASSETAMYIVVRDPCPTDFVYECGADDLLNLLLVD